MDPVMGTGFCVRPTDQVFSCGCKEIKFQKRRSLLRIAYQTTEKPTKNQAILIISIFILLSLPRRRLEAYETTTLLVHASDLCI
jgi:hypothetical protein